MFLKYVLGQKEINIEFMMQFCPKELLVLLNFDTFRIESGSYLDAKLRGRYADLVCSMDTYTGQVAHLNFIWEFKSDKENQPIPPQLLRYISGSIDADLKQKRKISLNIPILLYHGQQEMKKERLADLYLDIPEALKVYIPNFDFIFYLSATTKIKLTDMEILLAKMPKNKVKIPKGTIFEAMLESKAEGEAIGEARGEAKGEARVILGLMEQFPDWTDEKITQIAKVELSFVREVRKQLKGDKK